MMSCSEYLLRYFVRTPIARSNPDHKHLLSIYILYASARIEDWLDEVVKTNHRLLNRIELFYLQSLDRPDGHTVLFFNANNNIAATCVVKVIGKRTDASIDSIGIPSFLIFYTRGLDSSRTKKLLYADR